MLLPESRSWALPSYDHWLLPQVSAVLVSSGQSTMLVMLQLGLIVSSSYVGDRTVQLALKEFERRVIMH